MKKYEHIFSSFIFGNVEIKNRIEVPSDKVVLSMVVKPLHDEVEEFRGPAKELHMIGDCGRPRNLMSAMHDAFNIPAEM